MPTNKNALLRYKILDKLLSDKHHYYSLSDMTEKVNEKLSFDGFKPVSKRTIEKDIINLEEAPFSAPIISYRQDGKNIVKYNRKNYSIFYKELSDEEETLLCEALNTIGQFSGLANFDWLDGLQADFDIKKHRKVMMFSNNDRLRHNNMLASLFDCVSNQQVLELHYKRFESEEEIHEFHPYLLKQYNDRWYLVGYRPDLNAISTQPIDRIEGFEPILTKKLKPYDGDITKYFDEVIGVTVYDDAVVKDVIFWASDHELQYLSTKPMHGTQTEIDRNSEEGMKLAKKFPSTKDTGSYLKISCKQNFELERELCSHFGDVIVLEPKDLRLSIENRIAEMNERYINLYKN